MAVPVPRLALAAALLAACGSSRPADSTPAGSDQPADAGVSLGRPSEPPGDGGVPDLPAKVVPSSVLEGVRTGGNREVPPDDADLKAMDAAGKGVAAAVKLCVKASGAVTRVQLIKSSGYATWDEKILREMKSWTYGPITVDGNPADVCAPITFTYRPSASPPPAAP